LSIAYLGLGSNVGDREAMLRSALEDLDRPDLRLLRASSIYETEPVGFLDQRWFLNLVAEFDCELYPRQLLQRTQRTERNYGRLRTLPNGPRTLDIDILLYGNSVMKTAGLEIPHPRFRERRFVLAPLAELDPELLDPVSGKTVRAMLADLQGQSVRKVKQNLQARFD
jgi:2-amino-4-hydroxy-6-hydroxymethyldihydropteridine diphosphokinase